MSPFDSAEGATCSGGRGWSDHPCEPPVILYFPLQEPVDEAKRNGALPSELREMPGQLSIGADSFASLSPLGCGLAVSPGLRPRPSLSGRAMVMPPGMGLVSPGLRPRPSLSDGRLRSRSPLEENLVSPGLRPRPSLSAERCARSAHRAGDVSPGLRPRPSLSAPPFVRSYSGPEVSPGLRPRPSLSEHRRGRGRAGQEVCRRGFGPGLR